MKVLIVEAGGQLGQIWADHMRRIGAQVNVADSESAAVEYLRANEFEILVLSMECDDGAAISVADYASYRRPDMKVVFVSASSFFSDGSVFSYMSNACAMVPPATNPDDLAALVEYHAR